MPHLTSQLILIFIGSGLGGSCRFLVGIAMKSLSSAYPLSTLIVNVTGALFAGCAFAILERQNIMGSQIAALCLIGFLGGYTTFSAFALECWQLGRSGGFALPLIHMFLNVSLSILAVGIGYALVNQGATSILFVEK